ncbi:MAG TPA: hypothetical protein VFO83_00840, partial [Aggregicoccus sp.]|nr:hypothetical protein [Aggregicoccus sp.]
IAGTALLLGHGTGGPTKDLTVQNNILDGDDTVVSLGTQRPGLKMGANLYAAAKFETGGDSAELEAFKAEAGDSTSTVGSPGLDTRTFAPGSAAVDKGTDVKLEFCGAAPDIGAVETGC